jgi:hypothetical protein
MIGTHKRAGRCYCLLRCLRAFVLFLRVFQFLWCGVLSQHFIPPQHFAACVLFILRFFKPLLDPDPGGGFTSDSETAVRRFQK